MQVVESLTGGTTAYVGLARTAGGDDVVLEVLGHWLPGPAPRAMPRRRPAHDRGPWPADIGCRPIHDRLRGPDAATGRFSEPADKASALAALVRQNADGDRPLLLAAGGGTGR